VRETVRARLSAGKPCGLAELRATLVSGQLVFGGQELAKFGRKIGKFRVRPHTIMGAILGAAQLERAEQRPAKWDKVKSGQMLALGGSFAASSWTERRQRAAKEQTETESETSPMHTSQPMDTYLYAARAQLQSVAAGSAAEAEQPPRLRGSHRDCPWEAAS